MGSYISLFHGIDVFQLLQPSQVILSFQKVPFLIFSSSNFNLAIFYLSLGAKLSLVSEIVACILPDDALAPEDGPDLTVADAHGHDRHDVSQDEVDDVVAEGQKFSNQVLTISFFLFLGIIKP